MIRNYFYLLPPGEDFNLCLSLLPGVILGMPMREREQVAREWAWRHIFTGEMDATNGETNGLKVLRWLIANAKDNCGMGPLIACGTLVHAYCAICAALGIYTRMVAAVGPLASSWPSGTSPDNQAEYWDEKQGSWVFVNLGCNLHYVDPWSERRLSYLEMAKAIAVGNHGRCAVASSTGGRAIHRLGERFGDWTLFRNDAVISNGNAAFIGQPHDWHLLRALPPRPGVKTIWPDHYLVEDVPGDVLYPALWAPATGGV